LGEQFAADTAQCAIIFAATALVEERTHSSAYTAWMMLSSALPGVLCGPLAGVVVDRTDRVKVLITSNAARLLAAAGFVCVQGIASVHTWLVAICAICFLLSAAAQFISPAQGAITPQVTGRGSTLLAANSLIYLLSLATQALGVMLLAPLLLRVSGARAVGGMGLVLYGIATWVSVRLHTRMPAVPESSRRTLTQVWTDLRSGWRWILRDRVLLLAALQLTMVAGCGLSLVTLAPGMASRVFGARVSDLTFMVLPIGLGFGLALLLLGKRSQALSQQKWMCLGTLSFGLGLALLSAVSGWVWWALLLYVLATAAIGLGFALVSVTGRAMLQERPPAALRGRVLATQGALASVVGALPLPLVGALADRVGVRSVFLLMSLAVLLAGLSSWRSVRSKCADL